MTYRKIIFLLCALCMSCGAVEMALEFPDKQGILDFGDPENIKNELFVLTNPKSGSHLLLYTIIKNTRRPMRGRLPLWYFLNDPSCYPPENMMDYPLDFSKKTFYWGHEYQLLEKLNHHGNKLIYIQRDYKENIISNLILSDRLSNGGDLDKCFLKEILSNGPLIQEYIRRLRLFDMWDPDNRLLLDFKDLVSCPEKFVPLVMDFLEEENDCTEFIHSYDVFKKELRSCYDRKGNTTGSNEDIYYFRRQLSERVARITDIYLARKYPDLWEKYLK